MSGGSFNYLYRHPSMGELGPQSDYRRAAAALLEHGHTEAAAAVGALAMAIDNVIEQADDLTPVLHAIEWCVSGDIDDDELAAAVRLWSSPAMLCDDHEP